MISLTFDCPETTWPRGAEVSVGQHHQLDPSTARAYALSQAFLALVQERRGADLEPWRTEGVQNGMDQLPRFGRWLWDNLTAITAGLTLEWSNGTSEGQIHRLKRVKRQG
jgi:transposase